MKTFKNRVWKNTIGTFQSKPEKYFIPADHQEIVKIVLEAEEKGKKVRAVGSGHSFSSAAVIEDGNYIIDMSRLSRVARVNGPPHRNDEGPLVQVEAGITIRNLNNQLDKLGYSILIMGGIDHQTISGAISTGTHGTGLAVPAIHGMVRAIQLVTAGGKMLQLEPKDGISDPGQDKNGDFTIVRDENKFNAALVSLGAMGVIYAYILKVERKYWLNETKTLMLWSDVKPMLQDRSLLRHARGLIVQINPYTGLNREDPDDHTTLIISHRIRLKEPNVKWTSRMRNLMSGIAGNIPFIRWVVYKILLNRIAYNLIKLPKTIEKGLTSQEDKSYVRTAHKVYYQAVEYIKERAYDCEFAFDLKDDTYLDVVEAMIKNAKELRQQDPPIYLNAPINLRFVQRSGALITPEYQRDVCYVDAAMFSGSKNEKEVLDSSSNLMFELGGIPHWGKYNQILLEKKDQLHRLHPGLSIWKKVVKEFNPNGTFTSKLMKDLGLDELPDPNSGKTVSEPAAGF
jgi:FAD/FMN-containing dehydrogenase